MKAVVLVQSNPLAWQLMPEALDRVSAFCEKYRTDATAEGMRKAIVQNFAIDAPNVLLIVGLEDNGRLGGHLLITIEEFMGKTFATFFQYEMDHGVSRAQMKAWFAGIEAWAAGRGIEYFQALALDERIARIHRVFYGFKPVRILMRRPVVMASKATPENGAAVAQDADVEQPVQP